MNLIQDFPAQPWVGRAGSTLLHFLWQGVLIAAIYSLVRRFFASSAHPRSRYALACTTLLLMVAAPVLTWTLLRPAGGEAVAASFAAPLVSAGSPSIREIPTIATESARAVPPPFLAVVVAVWISGVICFLLRLTSGWMFTIRLRRWASRPAPKEWQSALDSLKSRLALSRPVRLLVSAAAQTPAAMGWLRPVVLVPVGALAGLPADQVEALLLHELAHIRRHDYLVNLLQSVVEAVLFYHPAVWWVSGHIRAERENCCDDLAIAITGDALTYARALSEVASAQLQPLRAAVAAAGGSLTDRVARLLGQARPVPPGASGSGIAAAILLAAGTAFVFAQSSPRLQFEAASIKPSTTQGFQMVRPHPGGLSATASLRLLIQNAYTVQPFQIVGAPAWIDGERFQIEARSAGNVGRPQLFLMLQSLLEDRFQLRIHREMREQPVFALVAAKKGFKLPHPVDGACETPPPDAPPDWAGGRMAPPGQGPAGLPRCGSLRVGLAASGAVIQGGKIAMPELVRVLAMVMGRAVVDRTGYGEPFDVKLEFLPDQATAALPPPPPGSAAALDSRFPSILTALQEQLGLRLESSRGPVDVIVVDRVERPSPN